MPRRPCPLKFGVAYRPANAPAFHAADYLTVWLGSHSLRHGNGFNPNHHGRMLDVVRAEGSTAVFYAYIIAMLARSKSKLRDCDVGEPSLCVHGADFIRQNEPTILALYEEFANETALRLGGQAQVVWLIEPDFVQYHAETQRGGGLSQHAMLSLFDRIVRRIKLHLPAAKVSLDVSPWVAGIEAWLRPFLERNDVDYLHTSGGRTTAASPQIKAAHDLTWSQLHTLSGRGTIADTGYGVGGAGGAGADPRLDAAWLDAAHLRARIADGVVAVTQVSPRAGWGAALPALRASLPPALHCFGSAAEHARRHGQQRQHRTSAHGGGGTVTAEVLLHGRAGRLRNHTYSHSRGRNHTGLMLRGRNHTRGNHSHSQGFRNRGNHTRLRVQAARPLPENVVVY